MPTVSDLFISLRPVLFCADCTSVIKFQRRPVATELVLYVDRRRKVRRNYLPDLGFGLSVLCIITALFLRKKLSWRCHQQCQGQYNNGIHFHFVTDWKNAAISSYIGSVMRLISLGVSNIR